ncbi:LysR substrate-binding domain-containing protein [Stenotrophomonas sp. CFBP8980]|jgi:DNA-binding transcriptional LysR family regulator|uniref:LysR substrate-binding domain-containing protein n=1 Tax=Stenotrophomonas sp. CFBP8980 TaxID=3096523 RepID=UPI0005AEF06A|nr:LysR substrate-binding domain-containing protein [Stenotrophomonas sp. CFBP8980]KIP86499.1 LysR family transcriptional regulator [Stenotrophomonas maltophilia]MDY1033426.1 LysR substrate-binding domain-containing protein [Stenotrophomonas sp. CFBP8980]
MIDLRLLRQFVAVAEEQHFHRAAARLHMSQPPLTAAIRRLEEQVGALLVMRGHRTVGLTAAGQVLLVEARRTLQQAENALDATREAAAGRSGRVRVAYVGSALYGRLPQVIRAFRRSHPQVRLELREATSRQQQHMLANGDVDVGVLIPPIPTSPAMQLQDFDVDALAIALPHAHPLASIVSLRMEDLATEEFVSWPAVEGEGFHSHVKRQCVSAGFMPKVVQEAHGMHAVLSLVAVETGIAIVPASMAGFRDTEVCYRPVQSEDARFSLSFCLRTDVDNPAVHAFVGTARGA